MLNGDESILDLGCGNGEFGRELAKRGHGGPYLGVDFSLPLLRDAENQPGAMSARFMEADLTQLSAYSSQLSVVSKQFVDTEHWALITAFAVLHHIPSEKMRLEILRMAHELLAVNGMFIHSHWQFLNSAKLKARIKPWQDAAIQPSAVEAGDYLLDWRSGGEGLRYVHHFSETELADLAQATGFRVQETFYSDGERGDLGLYQVWKIRA